MQRGAVDGRRASGILRATAGRVDKQAVIKGHTQRNASHADLPLLGCPYGTRHASIARVSSPSPVSPVKRSGKRGLEVGLASQRTEDVEVESHFNGPFPDRFELGDELGRGTFGVVHVATDVRNGEKYAVKILRKNDGCLSNMVRINNEVTQWKVLMENQHVVRLVDCFEDSTRVYLLQELCTGGDLRALFMGRPGHHLQENETAKVISTILELVSFCHDRNMLFGDIKPENFVLPNVYDHRSSKSGGQGHSICDLTVKAVDFGSVRDTARGGARGLRGSALYAAPEVNAGEVYGVEADMWSVGILLYHLLCGSPPFLDRVSGFSFAWDRKGGRELSIAELEFAIGTGVLDFNEKWDNISATARHLVTRMLERDVEKRITAREALAHPWIQTMAEGPPIYSNILDGSSDLVNSSSSSSSGSSSVGEDHYSTANSF